MCASSGGVRTLAGSGAAPVHWSWWNGPVTWLFVVVALGVGAVVVHLGAKGAGYYHNGKLITEGPSPVSRHVNTTGSGDVLSVCMMLMHERKDIPVSDKLHLANRIVAEFIEGRREFIPVLDE